MECFFMLDDNESIRKVGQNAVLNKVDKQRSRKSVCELVKSVALITLDSAKDSF